MDQEEIKKIFEALGKANINVAGDFVLEKNNTYTIEKVEAGGIGIQFVNGEEKESDSDETDAPIITPKGDTNPVKSFVDIVKLIMKNAEKDNGKEKPIKARGNGGTYIYNVDGETFGKVMDKLFDSHKDSIEDYLDGANAKKAVSMKYVCPFIGAILDAHLFTPPMMEKNDLEDALNSVYGAGSSASTKLSAKNISESGEYLIELLKVELKNQKSTPKPVLS